MSRLLYQISRPTTPSLTQTEQSFSHGLVDLEPPTLPNPIAATGGVGAGWFVIIKNNGTGTLTVAVSGGAIKIDPTSSGSSPIGGTASVQIQIANSSVFVTDGYNWFTYALAQTNVFNYTQYVAPLDSVVSSPFVSCRKPMPKA
jgi:hypothetical protein